MSSADGARRIGCIGLTASIVCARSGVSSTDAQANQGGVKARGRHGQFAIGRSPAKRRRPSGNGSSSSTTIRLCKVMLELFCCESQIGSPRGRLTLPTLEKASEPVVREFCSLPLSALPPGFPVARARAADDPRANGTTARCCHRCDQRPFPNCAWRHRARCRANLRGHTL